LDIKENEIKSKLPARFNTVESITASLAVENEDTGKSFVDEHREAGKLHTYMDNEGISHILSVYYISVPADIEEMTEEVLVDEFSVESSDYMDTEFDPGNSSYEQPRAYEKGSKHKKLYKNDKYDEIKNNKALFDLY
jgi:hypothetical protein